MPRPALLWHTSGGGGVSLPLACGTAVGLAQLVRRDWLGLEAEAALPEAAPAGGRCRYRRRQGSPRRRQRLLVLTRPLGHAQLLGGVRWLVERVLGGGGGGCGGWRRGL